MGYTQASHVITDCSIRVTISTLVTSNHGGGIGYILMSLLPLLDHFMYFKENAFL